MDTRSAVARTRCPYPRRVLAALAVAMSVAGVPTQAVAGPADDASTFVALINDTRWAHGLPELSPDRELQIIANRHANRMAEAGYIYHSANLGARLSSGWWAWSENVGYGPSVTWIHNTFMNSSHHAANILDSSFNYVGVGVAYGSDGKVYVAQVFGAW